MPGFEEQFIHFIDEALKEDIGDGDHTTLSCIPFDAIGRAELRVKQEGVLAGIQVAQKIFQYRYPDSRFSVFINDGQSVQAGDKAFWVDAPVHVILQCERLVLNTLQRMSGIATLTAQYVEQLKGFRTRIVDTRKTTPNFRLLEKEAVRIGGGQNHRMGLYDMILIKDNHIDYCGSITTAIERAYHYVQAIKPGLRIEVETRNLEEVRLALQTGKVHRIMLDNFSPADLAAAVQYIHGAVETEASGGIHLGNIKAYAATGVDFISVGGLIHQARSIDLSLKAIRPEG